MDKVELRKRKRQLQKNLIGLTKIKFGKDYNPSVIDPQIKSLASKIENINAHLIFGRIEFQKLSNQWILTKYKKCKIKHVGIGICLQNKYGNISEKLLMGDRTVFVNSVASNMKMLDLLPQKLAFELDDLMTLKDKFSTDTAGYSITLDLGTKKWKVVTSSEHEFKNKIFITEAKAGFACDLLNESKPVKRFILIQSGLKISTRKDNIDGGNGTRELQAKKDGINTMAAKQRRINEIINMADGEVAKDGKYVSAAPDFRADKVVK